MLPALKARPHHDFGLVFQAPLDQPIGERKIVGCYLYPALEKAGLPKRFTLCDARHRTATWPLSSDVLLHVVSERLGHKSPTITFDRYCGRVPNRQAQAAERLEELVAEQR